MPCKSKIRRYFHWLDWALLSVVILFHHWLPLLEKVEIQAFILPRNFPAVLIIFTERGGGPPPSPQRGAGRGTPPSPRDGASIPADSTRNYQKVADITRIHQYTKVQRITRKYQNGVIWDDFPPIPSL